MDERELLNDDWPKRTWDLRVLEAESGEQIPVETLAQLFVYLNASTLQDQQTQLLKFQMLPVARAMPQPLADEIREWQRDPKPLVFFETEGDADERFVTRLSDLQIIRQDEQEV